MWPCESSTKRWVRWLQVGCTTFFGQRDHAKMTQADLQRVCTPGCALPCISWESSNCHVEKLSTDCWMMRKTWPVCHCQPRQSLLLTRHVREATLENPSPSKTASCPQTHERAQWRTAQPSSAWTTSPHNYELKNCFKPLSFGVFVTQQ